MTKITRIEDLKCWQAARKLEKEIYLICEQGKLAKDYDTRSQLKRAALSSMSNIAEGFGKFSTKEFIKYLDTYQRSVLEVKSILYVLSDLEYLENNKIEALHGMTDDTRHLTLASIRYLRNRNKES